MFTLNAQANFRATVSLDCGLVTRFYLLLADAEDVLCDVFLLSLIAIGIFEPVPVENSMCFCMLMFWLLL